MAIVEIDLQISELFDIFDYEYIYEEAYSLPSGAVKINSPDGYVSVNSLVRKHHDVAKYILDDTTLTCSTEHIVFSNGVPIQIKNATVIDTIYGPKNIIGIEVLNERDVFDVSLNDPHQYVTPNGIIHHNTTLYQMYCGLVNDYAQAQNRPFVVEVFTPDMISSYQGKTAQNAKQVLTNGMDPHVFGSVLFDDVDQTTASRGDDKASAGQQEVTSVLMETLAGANTIVRGNASAFLFSNYPEKVDDALRQRCGLRWLVDGPQSLEDYQDILAILLGKNHTLKNGDIDLFVTQDIKKAIGKSYEKHNVPQDEKLLKVFDKMSSLGKLDTIEKLGIYLDEIKNADPRFTGRAVKNITDSCKMRSADFEVPDEWVENPDVFVNLDYDRKVDMLRELVTPITPEMLLQEINRYADSEFRYADKSDEAAIEEMVRYDGQKKEAMKRINEAAKG